MTENSWNPQNPQKPQGGSEPNPAPADQDQTVPLNTAYPGDQGRSSYGSFGAYQPQPDPNAPYEATAAPYRANAGYEKQAQKRKPGFKALTAVALLSALLGGGAGGAVVAASDFSTASGTASLSSGTTIVNNTDSVNAVTAAAAKATSSTVTIAVASTSESGAGSGVVLDDEGHILTNTHVVTLDGATASAKIEVQLSDGSVRTASVVGTDPTSDLAVIKLNDVSGLTLTPASLGDSGNLNVGDTAIAIGAPLGLENTVTTGIVSNLARTIEVESSAVDEQQTDSSAQQDPFGSSPFQFEMPGQQSQSSTNSTISINVIQTDAAVNPGNSGGALVNADGEVIGINVAIASTDSGSSSSGNIGVGFAIPINYAKRVSQEIIENGFASHGLLGASVSTSPANNDQSEAFGDGALIQEVVSGGAADQAGLRNGDVVVAIDGRSISEATELTAAVREAAAGSKVSLTINRNGSIQDVDVTLGDSRDAG